MSLCLDPDPNADPVLLRLVPEERITFGINPAVSSVTTVSQIREDYNEVDCRLIAKEVRTMRILAQQMFLLFWYKVIFMCNYRWR